MYTLICQQVLFTVVHLQQKPEGCSLSSAPLLFASSSPEDQQAQCSAAAGGLWSAKVWRHTKTYSWHLIRGVIIKSSSLFGQFVISPKCKCAKSFFIFDYFFSFSTELLTKTDTFCLNVVISVCIQWTRQTSSVFVVWQLRDVPEKTPKTQRAHTHG